MRCNISDHLDSLVSAFRDEDDQAIEAHRHFFQCLEHDRDIALSHIADMLGQFMDGAAQDAARWALRAIGQGATMPLVGALRMSEPGVRVEKVMLTANTPALRLSPATPGPHPIALLAHGATGSKENLFRFGEALAAAGFDCYSVDQAGHRESPQPCSFWHVDGNWRWATNILLKPRELERALGAVDVFIGHSMGAGAGEWSVSKDRFRPKLFIGVGADVELGEHWPPVLLLAGLQSTG